MYLKQVLHKHWGSRWGRGSQGSGLWEAEGEVRQGLGSPPVLLALRVSLAGWADSAMPCSPITDTYTLGLHKDVLGLATQNPPHLQGGEALHFLSDHPRNVSNGTKLWPCPPGAGGNANEKVSL